MHVLGQLQKLLIVHAGPYSLQQPTIDHKTLCGNMWSSLRTVCKSNTGADATQVKLS